MLTRVVNIGFTIALITSLLPNLQSQERNPVSLTPPSIPVPASYFDIHLHGFSEDSWPQVAFSELRSWDSRGTIWYTLEPRKGQWSFRQLDEDVSMAEQHKVGLLLTLGQTPQWASSRPTEPPTYRTGAAAPPKNEEDWKTYVRTVATRYQGHIHEYEIWNEPNLNEFYSGTTEELFTLAKDAYEIIHEIDPTAIVISPSITGFYAVGWLNHYLDLGGGKYADVIGYHFYTTPHSPEAAIVVIQQVKAAMHSHGINKPLWNTEAGYLIKSDFHEFPPGQGSMNRILSHEEALAYVMRSYLLNWASGVSRLYWYDWDGGTMGLGDNSGKQQKPAAKGYNTIEEWLAGSVVRSCSADIDNNWTCEVSRDKKDRWIVWNAEHTVTKTIPISWKVSQFTTLTPSGSISTGKLDSSRNIAYSTIPTLLR
jgi:Glycosyl hydrolases family 39